MGQPTEIAWCDASWNPTRGCSRVSEGCRNCFAEQIAARFSDPGAPFHGFAKQTKSGPRWTGRVELVPEALDWPLRVHRPAWVQRAEEEGRRPRIFVNSMSDLFHERLSDEAIAAVFGVMAAAPRVDFLVLTKRAERMRRWFEWAARVSSGDPWMLLDDATNALNLTVGQLGRFYEAWRRSAPSWPLPNVWLGVSVEDQPSADERIPHLLDTPAAIRFVSYEPALAAVDFEDFLTIIPPDAGWPNGRPALDWLIVGGESGPGARPFDLAWARSTVEQCRAAGVPAFVKQLGAAPIETDPDPTHGHFGCVAKVGDESRYFMAKRPLRLRNRKGGDMSEWPEDLRIREFPSAREETKP